MAARTRWVSMAMVAATLVACSPAGDGGRAPPDDKPPAATPPSRSGLGAFLAGRLAQSIGDTDVAAEYFAAALARDPDNTDLLQRTFTLMVIEGRMDRAIPMARRLQDLDADAAVPILVSGLADVHDGLLVQAESRFASLPHRGLNGLVGPLLTAWALAGQGRPDPALVALEPLALNKAFANIRSYHAALINDLSGRPEAARAGYEAALEGGALSIRGIEAAGSLYQRQGQAELAGALYQAYVADHPDTLLFDAQAPLRGAAGAALSVPDAKAGMAEALFDMATLMRQGNGQEAALVFARLALYMRPDFPLAQAVLGDLLTTQGRLNAANQAYGSIAVSSAARAYGLLRIAVNQEEMDDTAAALATLDRLSKDRPDALDPLVTRGDILRRKKRYAEAAAAYDRAIAHLGPEIPVQYWPLLYSRGICLERIKQWPRAEADFKLALRLKPDQPDVLNYLGYTWVDAGVNLEAGRAMLERAVSLRPRDGAIVDSLGWALYRLGDYSGAVQHLERAVELKADDPTINDHLGDAYWQVGRVAEAVFQWRRAQAMNPEPEQIEPLKEKLRTGQVPSVPTQ